jgi:hypothetical protein
MNVRFFLAICLVCFITFLLLTFLLTFLTVLVTGDVVIVIVISVVVVWFWLKLHIIMEKISKYQKSDCVLNLFVYRKSFGQPTYCIIYGKIFETAKRQHGENRHCKASVGPNEAEG